MRTMINYSQKQLEKIKKIFPNLNFIENEKKIWGELDFHARYKNIKFNGLSEWIIVQCSPTEKNCITDVYSIEINLDQQDKISHSPKVFEADGRIQKLAKSLGKSFPLGEVTSVDKALNNMHLNKDGSCCLGIFAPSEQLSLYDFMLERVYPYFVWQAYFDKYKETPPCGECPHDWVKAINIRIEDTKNHIKILRHRQNEALKVNNKNSFCRCGSGKKYKNCCSKSDQKMECEIKQTEQEIQLLQKNKHAAHNPGSWKHSL